MTRSAPNIQNCRTPQRPASIALGTGRGIALFFAAFSMLNLGGELVHAGFDANGWWLDTRVLPESVGHFLMLAFSVLLIEFARQPAGSKTVLRLQKLVVVSTILVALRDAWTFYSLLSRGVIASEFPLPFSLIVAVLLLVLLATMHLPRPSERTPIQSYGVIAFSALLCVISFPLLQIHCFGWTDYRRPGDAAVVFGCKVYSDGSLSAALSDRVRSACDLYHDGLVAHLIMSGGPGRGDVHETEAMRDFAVKLGVPSDSILTDRMGLSTDETVTNTVPLFRKHGFTRVLAVSHFFHLPRIKLTYQRAGVDVFTVPARQKHRLPNRHFMMVREVVALWAYYARPLTGL
jgi:uncharacterized SAM-binding protein YcdF (DUF218 family)